MCGIVGVASITQVLEPGWLALGRDAMTHRGPDGAGAWWSADGRVGLGHRRLAILDLSAAGRQPMHDEAEGLTIAFNGEIYNFQELRAELSAQGYRFRSSSDTEVILAAYARWQEGCISRLEGAFAFALHDMARRRVLLARDRAGEKPLFYREAEGCLAFASELKALLHQPGAPRRIAPFALECYLALGFVPGEHCILEGYRKLPPAHALTFDLGSGQVTRWRYWQPPVADPGPPPSEGALLEELETLLEAAVRRQLVADVPVGILLSGGVDSSLITAMAARTARQVKTFTIRFPGQGALDETEHARLIAAEFDTDHVELTCPPNLLDQLPALAHQFDEPIADSSMLPTYLVSQLVRQHCTVALGGDGGDELFGGYVAHDRLLRLHAWAARVPLAWRRAMAAASARALPVGLKGRGLLQGLGADFVHGAPWTPTLFDAYARTGLLGQESPDGPLLQAVNALIAPAPAALLDRALQADFLNYLPENILVKVDRASMLASLEVRAPWLDRSVMEFAFRRVPPALKATRHDRKILPKRLTARVLPAAFDRSRKQGFSVPINAWFSGGPTRAWLESAVGEPDSVFSGRGVQALLRGQDRGFANGSRLFALTVFEMWRQHYGARL